MNYSELAKKLWPFLRQDVQKLTTNGVATRSSSGSGSGVSDHGALVGLSDDDHTQYLRTDGTRTLTGDMSVSSGITIDGVDLSAHVGDADAHHTAFVGLVDDSNTSVSPDVQSEIQIAGGAGLTSTAGATVITLAVGAGDGIDALTNTVAVDVTDLIGGGLDEDGSNNLTLADSVAGDGLTISSKILAVGAGDGIDVAANTVAVDVTDLIGAGLTEEATNNIALATPGTLTYATSNSASAPHTHAVTASDNVGSSGTVEETLLKSDASGGLVLNTLTVNGDDLRVEGQYGGDSPLVLVDHSIHSVGFGMIPDPQFMVDVNGPLRATYLIGKHAIQLSDVEFLAHFDGPGPFQNNFTGTPLGHMGQVPSVSGGVIYRPGKFGSKAIQVGRGTTNLVENPSFENNLTDGWTNSNSAVITAIHGSSANGIVGGYVGDNFCKLVASGGGGHFYTDVTGPGDSIDVSVSVWYRRGSGVVFRLYDIGTSTTLTSETLSDAGESEWKHAYLTATTPVGSGNLRVYFTLSDGETIDLGGVQLEAISLPTPFCDGRMGEGHSWSGTAHNSTSTRTDSSVVYSEVVPKDKFTVIAWVKIPHDENEVSGGTQTSQRFIQIGGNYTAASSLSLMKFRTTNTIKAYFNDTTAPTWTQAGWSVDTDFTSNDWVFVAFSFDYANDTATLYSATESSGLLSSTHSSLGSGFGGGSDMNLELFDEGSGWLDDLVVVHDALDADLIRSIYESNAPVFAETSMFSFRTPTASPVWADDEGLWVRGTNEFAGDAIFGVYGADVVGDTKAWGGLTLYQGDVLLGNSTGGYVRWHSYQDSTDPYGEAGLEIQDAVIDMNSSAVLIDPTDGITITTSTGYSALRALTFLEPGGGDLGEVAAYSSGTTSQMRLETTGNTTVQTNVNALGSTDGTVRISASGSVGSATLSVIGGAASGEIDMVTDKLDITISGAGNSASDPTTDAPADWLPVTFGGTDYYIPLYS